MDQDQLPNDIEALQKRLLSTESKVATYQERNQELERQITWLKKQLFGSKSERQVVDAPEQLNFEFVDLPAASEKVAEPNLDAAEQKQEHRHAHGRNPIPAHIPRERIEHTLPEEQRKCSCCGETMHPFGEELSEQIEVVPAKVFAIQHVRIKYSCRTCQEKPAIAEVPHKVIDKSLAAPGLLAEIANDKFNYHLPLNRQETRYAESGIHLPRSTMCQWMGVMASLLTPIVDCMKREVLSSQIILTDDTPVPVQDPGKGKTKTGRLWVYLDSNQQHAVFDYTPTRSRDGPVKFLKGFKGYLQADAYAGYDGIYASGGVIEVACWAHCRRKFFDAQETDARASEMLALVRELYAVEELGKSGTANLRRELREIKSRPILQRIHAWLESRRADTLPISPFGQAIGYARAQWQALNRYVENGNLNIDNNRSENALRKVALGRKNYLFFGNDDGGRRAAIFYSLIVSCKLRGIHPAAYLKDVLLRIDSTPATQIASLTPARWQTLPE